MRCCRWASHSFATSFCVQPAIAMQPARVRATTMEKSSGSVVANLCWSIQKVKPHEWVKAIPDPRCQRARKFIVFWCDFHVPTRPQIGLTTSLIPNFRVQRRKKTCHVLFVEICSTCSFYSSATRLRVVRSDLQRICNHCHRCVYWHFCHIVHR